MSLLDLDFTSDVSDAIQSVSKAILDNLSEFASFAAQVEPNSAAYQQLQADKDDAVAQAKQETDALAAANAADVADKGLVTELQAELDAANATIASQKATIANLISNSKLLAGVVDSYSNAIKPILVKNNIPLAAEAPVSAAPVATPSA